MGEKSEQKRSHIIDCARAVFAAKGFRAVTMKDIVEACQISRGGLYLYFTAIEEIFLAVARADHDGGDSGSDSLPTEATPTDILALFMKEQKKEILRKKDSLAVAVYEYYFAQYMARAKVAKKDNIPKRQFETGVLILENLIGEGHAAGEFFCEDARGAASNIMYALEGLKIMARTGGLSEAAVDRELLYILQGLVVE